jgi:hypothetical protein
MINSRARLDFLEIRAPESGSHCYFFFFLSLSWVENIGQAATSDGLFEI